jgi:hypothetical protein
MTQGTQGFGQYVLYRPIRLGVFVQAIYQVVPDLLDQSRVSSILITQFQSSQKRKTFVQRWIDRNLDVDVVTDVGVGMFDPTLDFACVLTYPPSVRIPAFGSDHWPFSSPTLIQGIKVKMNHGKSIAP